MGEYAESDGKEALGMEVKKAAKMAARKVMAVTAVTAVTAVNMAVVSMDMAVDMRHYGGYTRECGFMSHTWPLRVCGRFSRTYTDTSGYMWAYYICVNMERGAICMAVCEGPVKVHAVCVVVGR